MRRVYSYLLLPAQNIQLQEVKTVMHIIAWYDQWVTNSFKLVFTANWTHDNGSSQDYELCSLFMTHMHPKLGMME